MVGFVELPTLQEGLQDQDKWAKLWVLFLEEFYQFHTVYTIGSIKGDIHIDISRLVLQFDQRHLRVLEWLDTFANTALYQSVRNFVDLGDLRHLWIVNQEVNVGHWKIESGSATSKHHDNGVWVAGPHHFLDPFDQRLSRLFFLWRLLNPFDEVQNLRVEQRIDILNPECLIAHPGVVRLSVIFHLDLFKGLILWLNFLFVNFVKTHKIYF
jgi:hypothetical protein